jgi:uncharacterized membrane protein YhhN
MNRAFVSLAYAALALVYLVVFEHNESWGGAVAKAAPILLLAAAAVRIAAPAWRLALLLALLLSALGDVLLAAHAIVGGLWVAGLGAFLLAQLVYAQQFWRHRSPLRSRRWLALGYVPIAALLAWRIVPAAGELALPVGAYLLAITAMVTGAALADRPLALFAGALCFAFSDGSIAVNRFIAPIPHAGLVIMLSYYVAQWLLWHGALGAPQERTAPA